MSWTDDLETGIAARTATLDGVGTWDPDGTTGNIATGGLPDQPDNAVGVQAYGLIPDPVLADVVQPVQFFIRGDLAYVKTTAATIFDEFAGLTNVVIGGIPCPGVDFHNEAPMGLDQAGRHQLAVHYYVAAMRQSASRLD